MKISPIRNNYINHQVSQKTQTAKLENFGFVSISSPASNAIKNSEIARINFTGLKKTQTQEIISKLENKYGIKAEFDNFWIAKSVLECVEEYAKLNNNDIFKGLIIKKENSGVENSPWSFETKINEDKKEFILYFENHYTEKDYAENAKRAYNDCYIPTSKPKYYFYEALANFLNFNYNPWAFKNNNACNFSESLAICARKYGDCVGTLQSYCSAFIASRMCGVETPPISKKYFEELSGAKLDLPKNQITKPYFDKIKTFKNIESAVEYLKKYGIEAEFENLESANYIISAIEDFIEINGNKDLFKGLKIEKTVMENHVVAGVETKTNLDTNEVLDKKIVLNCAYDWQRHKERAWVDYKTAHHGSYSPKYSLYHELAHWLQINYFPQEFIDLNIQIEQGMGGPIENEIAIYGKVSDYATSNSIEFLAEYISSKMCGLTFPKAVDDEYRRLTKLQLKFPEIKVD